MIPIVHFNWPHVKEIPNSRFLVSLNHSDKKCAAMKIFDVSMEGEPKEIYSFEEVLGGIMTTTIKL